MFRDVRLVLPPRWLVVIALIVCLVPLPARADESAITSFANRMRNEGGGVTGDCLPWRKASEDFRAASDSLSKELRAVAKAGSAASATDKARVAGLETEWLKAVAIYVIRLDCRLRRDEGKVGAAEKRELLAELRAAITRASFVTTNLESSEFVALVDAVKKQRENDVPVEILIQVYERLGDQTTRAALVAHLEKLGAQDQKLARDLKREDLTPQALADLLLKADRAAMASTVDFLHAASLSSGTAANGSRWLRVLLRRPKDISGVHFVQATKELLTGITNEGISPDQEFRDEGALAKAVCDCRGVDCAAVLVVSFAPKGDEVVAFGDMLFRDGKIKELCAETTTPTLPPATVKSPAFRDCPKDASDSCVARQVHAAHGLMNQLSGRFSVFGSLAFERAPTQADSHASRQHRGLDGQRRSSELLPG
jgi:hypothetical protein